MDQLQQCPVCTLFLHNGMSLESHLDTHPKDQVIKALCNLSNNLNFPSRNSTPASSEYSYNRFRTPATDDFRWNNGDQYRIWHRTPNRPSKSNSASGFSYNDSSISNIKAGSFDVYSASNQYPESSCSVKSLKSDKSQQTNYSNTPIANFENQLAYYQDQDENELKYSRSDEYSSLETPNIFVHNKPLGSTRKPMVQKSARKEVKILPKPNNIVIQSTGLQYISQGIKPVHMVVPAPSDYIQRNVRNNLIITGNVPSAQMLENKTAQLTNQIKRISNTYTPGTRVVTQNSQIIYGQMVHSIDGKQLVPNMPAVVSSSQSVSNIAQTSTYQNLMMVIDQIGNSSSMYTPQEVAPKINAAQNKANTVKNKIPDTKANKALVIGLAPLIKKDNNDSSKALITSEKRDEAICKYEEKTDIENTPKCDSQGPSKGLKIISNIKVEAPMQHHKSLLNTIVDLTKPEETSDAQKNQTDTKLDLFGQHSKDTSQANTEVTSCEFSVIKNVGKVPVYKETSKLSNAESKADVISTDSCSVPDLICNEKPSISPYSVFSEFSESSRDQHSISPKPQKCQTPTITDKSDSYSTVDPLKVDNPCAKKTKKILQIKKAKSLLESSHKIDNGSSTTDSSDTIFSGSSIEAVDHVAKGAIKKSEIDHKNLDTDTEEHSMEIEPSTSSNKLICKEAKIKQEVPTYCDLSNLESIRPINIVSCNNAVSSFDKPSDRKDILDLENTTKTKQFVNMINENYFADNLYEDYITPDRYDDREFSKESSKEAVYSWGEPSQRDNEFVLPSFIYESYKIAESSGLDYSDIRQKDKDSKSDVLSESRSIGESPLNICADERMPPRGEISGQESNDMESPWSGIYSSVATEPHDLMARESWVSDGSDIDTSEKPDHIEGNIKPGKRYNCAQCGLQFTLVRELRAHKALCHSPPTSSGFKTTYSRLLTSRTIKKEEKPPNSLDTQLPTADSKEVIASAILQQYVISEAKPKIEGIIKQETKRRKRDFVCPTCKVDQGNEISFNEHLKIHPLECLTCGKCFYRRPNLALHIKMHLGIRNYECEVCKKRFMTRQKLSEHHNTHTGRAPVKCTLCDDTFRRYSNMLQHRHRHHYGTKPRVREHVCACGAVFRTRARLLWHRETHASRPRACPHCSERFVHAASLTRHVRRAHDEYYLAASARAVNVPCPVCKQIYLKSNLRAHMQTHSGAKPFVCVICSKAFTTKWNLKLHKWTHMSRSAKPFKCTLCKGAFIRQSEYVSHMNSHKSFRPYTCNHCGRKFIRKYNCQRHVREHEVAKKYVCKECGKSFHRGYYLSDHMKVHNGVRPFCCNICGKTSSNKSNHNKHVKIHHAREPVATET